MKRLNTEIRKLERECDFLEGQVAEVMQYLWEGGPGSGRKPGGHGYGHDSAGTPKYGFHNPERNLPNALAIASNRLGYLVNGADKDYEKEKTAIKTGKSSDYYKGFVHGEHKGMRQFTNDLKGLVQDYEKNGDEKGLRDKAHALAKTYDDTPEFSSPGKSGLDDYKNEKGKGYKSQLRAHSDELKGILKRF